MASLEWMSDSICNLRTVVMCALLVLVTLAVFWPATRGDFIFFDDDRYVTENPMVQSGLNAESAAWAFRSTVASNWHPLTWWSHELDCEWHGLRPRGHHLTSVVLHAANAGLLFLFLAGATGARWRSALAAGLFAWHPLHVESVAWVAERKDVLSTFFWLLALLAYLKYAKTSGRKNPRSRIFYGLALLFFAAGLLSKPMVVTLPFGLLLMDAWPLGRNSPGHESGARKRFAGLKIWRRLVGEKIPFFILSGASCAVTFWAQNKGGAVQSMGSLPAGGRMANAAVSWWRYIGKTVWPFDLAVFYPYPEAWPGGAVLCAVAGLLAVSGWVVWLARRRPYLAVGWFWYLGTLVPVIGLVQVGGQAMADRYTYVPLIGLFIMAAWGLGEVVKSWPATRGLAVIAGGILLAAGVWRTSLQEGYWRDSETLFKHAIQATGDNYTICANLGGFLSSRGRMDEAAHYYAEALRIRPDLADAQANMGYALLEQGQPEAAAGYFKEALRIDPNHPEAHLNLGKVLMRQGNLPAAEAEFRQAAALRSEWPAPARLLGEALAEQGDLPGAITEYAAAAEWEPGDATIQTELGALFGRQNQPAEALRHYRDAVTIYRRQLRLRPEWAEALNNLAWLLATNPNREIRDGADAARLAERACELTHRKNALAMGTLAAAYAEAGRFAEAVATAQAARETALVAGQKEVAERNGELLKLYQAGHSYREAY